MTLIYVDAALKLAQMCLMMFDLSICSLALASLAVQVHLSMQYHMFNREA
jgi:hypothetical protein